jgi:hypothetical protein
MRSKWSSLRYAQLGAGFFCLVFGGWVMAALVRFTRRVVNAAAT